MSASPTLSRLFGLASPEAQEAMRAELAARMTHENVLVPGIAVEATAGSITQSLTDALNIPLADVLGGAWGKARELIGFRDRTKYPPERIGDCKLEGQPVGFTMHPRLQLMVNGAPWGAELIFDVEATLRLAVVVLRIKDACIIHAKVGEITGHAAIRWRGHKLVGRDTGPFVVGGEFEFPKGVSIGPRLSDAAEAPAAT